MRSPETRAAYCERARLVSLLAGTLFAAACGSLSPPPTGPQPATPEVISFATSEGTHLAFDLSPDGRTIVFDLLGQLWLLPAEGGEARLITDAVRDTAEDLDPSFSPEGQRVLFRGERGGRRGMWVMDLEAGSPRQLTRLPDGWGWEGQGAWAPGGRTLAFARASSNLVDDSVVWRSEIELLDPETCTPRTLRIEGLPSRDVRDPAWSPDGDWLAFVTGWASSSRGGRIWSVPASGGAARPLTPEGIEALAPAFSPDGRRLAFFAPDSAGRRQVWLQGLTAEGAASGQPLRLTQHADVTPTRVRWSPDGTALLYSADGRLWRMPAVGGSATEIPFTARLEITRERRVLPPVRFPAPGVEQEAHSHLGLVLSPDGRQIGVLALGKVWVVPVGGEPQAVAEIPSTAHGLAWSPDGAELTWAAGTWGEEDLYSTNTATGATRHLTALPGREVLPSWSPDGRYLAFVHVPPDSAPQLRVVEARTATLDDPGETQDLGPIDISWLAESAAAPVWSPDSQGLLVQAEWEERRPARAEIVTPAGERRRLERFPDAPIFLQWPAGDSVFFVRHDRLWKAAFEPLRGLRGEPEPLGPETALYASAARDGMLLYLSETGWRLRSPSGAERRLGWPLRYTPPVPEPLLIRNVRIIDGTGAPPSPPSDLLVRGGKIVRITPTGHLHANGDAEVLEAGGRTLIPGLIELHMHVYVPGVLPGILHYGITTVRDQGSSMGRLAAHGEAIAAGVLPGPRVSLGGFQFFSDWPFDTEEWRGVEPEADPGHLERAVALAAAFGAHHIKTRTFRRWDLNARFIDAAHQRGMRVTGHCAHPLPLVAAGIDAKEHIGVCAPRGNRSMYDDLIQLLRSAGIAVVPTVIYWALAVQVNLDRGVIPDPSLEPWEPIRGLGWMLALTPEAREAHTRDAERAREATARLHRAGVTIGTGTDVWQVPWAVHLEMEELVRAGLSPLEVIHATTGAAARILGAEAELGTIEVGKWADLLLLDADPLEDIRNTRRIWRVVQGGRVVDREALRQMAAPLPRSW